MGNRTDLEGALTRDEESFAHRLHSAVAKGQLKESWELRATLQQRGTSASPVVAKLSQGRGLVPDAIDGICSAVASQIVDKHGNNPAGYLRIKCFTKGNSVTPEVDFNRTIDVSLIGEEDTEIQVLRAQLTVERNHGFRKDETIERLTAQIVNQSGQAHQLTASTVASFTSVASVRAQIGAAGEAGQLHSALGVLLLFAVIPALRDAFNLPDDMPVTELVRLGMQRFKKMVSGDGTKRAPAAPPRASSPPDLSAPAISQDDAQPTDEEPSAEAEGGNVTTTRPTTAEIVEWICSDPMWALELVNALKADPRSASLLSLAGVNV